MRRRIVAGLIALMVVASPTLAQTLPETNFPDPVIQSARDRFVAGDHAGAMAILRPLAEAGAVRAQTLLGAAHQHGLGVAPDPVLAQNWFGRAAAQGYPTAMHNLGVLLENGMPGLAPDRAAARGWYQQAGALDYGPSLGNLGGMLLTGDGGPVDLDGGIAVLRRGAQMGDPGAVNWLAWAHHTATGLPEDLAEARRLYEIAALNGKPDAANEFGMMLEFGAGGPVDLPRAREFYQRAIAGGVAQAGINAAWLTFGSPDLFPDQVQGLTWCFWAAATAPEPEASEYAGFCEVEAGNFTGSEVRQARKGAEAM